MGDVARVSTMWDEIHEQPQAIEHTLEREHASISTLVREIQKREIRHVVIAARGTSDNAATYAKYLFEILVGVPVSLAAPSIYTLYDGKINLYLSLNMEQIKIHIIKKP